MSDAEARSPYRALLWPVIYTIPALALLIGLGIWQIQRLHWKEGLLAHIHDQMHAPAVDLPVKIDNPKIWEYRRVRVTGHYQNGKELYLYAAGPGSQAGYLVFTPLVRAEGKAVLVNRGWVPEKLKDPKTREKGQREGTVTIEGIGRLTGGAGPFTPDNEPAKNEWFQRDIPQMAKAVGEPLAPVIIDRDDAPVPGGWPLGGRTRIDIPNNHLEYAITWFSLAYVLVIIFAIYAWRAFKAAKSPSDG